MFKCKFWKYPGKAMAITAFVRYSEKEHMDYWPEVTCQALQHQKKIFQIKTTHKCIILKSCRGQTAEARRTTILQPVEQKPHSQKDRQDEKAEDYVSDEGTR